MRTPTSGMKLAIAATFATVQAFSAASNAAECVLTFAADPGLAAGNIVHVTVSGWPRLENLVARVKTVTGAGPYSVTLEGIDTTSTALFPTGEGAGSLREVLTWQTLSQVLDVLPEGGQQQYGNYQYVDEDDEREYPITRSASRTGVEIHDDETHAGYPLLVTAQDTGAIVPFRQAFKTGAARYFAAYVSVASQATTPKNGIAQRRLDLAVQGRPKFYAS